MAKKRKDDPKQAPKQPSKRQSVFQEAWSNMMGDMDKVLPEKLKGKQGKKKFVLWLFILEVVVFGVVGKFIYDWLTG